MKLNRRQSFGAGLGGIAAGIVALTGRQSKEAVIATTEAEPPALVIEKDSASGFLKVTMNGQASYIPFSGADYGSFIFNPSPDGMIEVNGHISRTDDVYLLRQRGGVVDPLEWITFEPRIEENVS